MEGLIGVLIGAVIGYVAAITTLLVEHRRWRKEFKLQYLLTERIRREEQCDKIKELFHKGLNDEVNPEVNPYELGVLVGARLPLKVVNLIQEALKESDHSDEGAQNLNEEVFAILETYLSEIDKQIEELTQ